MTEESKEDTAETPAVEPKADTAAEAKPDTTAVEPTPEPETAAEPAPKPDSAPASPPPAAPSPGPTTPAASIAPDIPPPALEGITDPVGPPPTLVERHPEVLVGAAFVGGIVLAHLIRRRGD